MDAYSSHDGVGLADLVRKGEVSPAELTEAAIARIEAHNPKLNAVVFTPRLRKRAAKGAAGPLPERPLRRACRSWIKDLGLQGKRLAAHALAASTPATSTPTTTDSELVRPLSRRRASSSLGKTNTTPEYRHHRHDRERIRKTWCMP